MAGHKIFLLAVLSYECMCQNSVERTAPVLYAYSEGGGRSTTCFRVCSFGVGRYTRTPNGPHIRQVRLLEEGIAIR
uniref:Putative secreted peptide n=1 Tax=Anopheles braziliensis TaxID=58242 RepID=A0A2M3ZVN7_9DIPT